MTVVEHSSWRRLAKQLAFALALLSILFLLQATTHSHTNGQDVSACRLCQIAHQGVAPAVSALELSVPLVSFGQVTATCTLEISLSFFEHSPSRAPPSFLSF